MTAVPQQKNKTLPEYWLTPRKAFDIQGFTNADVEVYSYMLNRFMFFSNKNMLYYENQDVIATNSSQSESSVKRAIKKLEQEKLLEVKKKKVGNAVSNTYVLVDRFNLYSKKLITKNKQKESWLDEEDTGLPF